MRLFSGQRWRIWVLVAAVVVPVCVYIPASLLIRPEVLPSQSLEPGVFAARFREAEEALRNGQEASAQSKLEALLEGDAFNGLVYGTLGQLHQRAGRLEEAIAATRLAVATDPRFLEARYNLACLLLKSGRNEEALAELAESVSLGFDVRTPALADPDLEPLRQDARFKVYLEGARAIPLRALAATLSYDPPVPTAGVPFEMALEGVLVDHVTDASLPTMTVAYGGPLRDSNLFPLKATLETLVVPEGAISRVRFTYRFTLVARAAFVGRPGPWEVQLGGVLTQVSVPVLTVRDATDSPSPIESGFFGRVPLFRPKEFFARPSRPLTAGDEGMRLEYRASGSAWEAPCLELTIGPLESHLVDALDLRLDTAAGALAYYDRLEPLAAGKLMFQRVYALSSALPMDARGRRVGVDVLGKHYVLDVALEPHSAEEDGQGPAR